MIYLDYNATTPVDPAVAEAMQPYIGKHFGNPSSGHEFGQSAKKALIRARTSVAGLIECHPEEIIFTSGGSESNNMVLKGLAFSLREKGRHIITSLIEHPAVINPCKFLERLGFTVSYIPVDRSGIVDPDAIKNAITGNTILISIMHANNETGSIQPIEEIGRIAGEKGILFHTDAAQSVGKIPIDVKRMNVDFLTIAGHKLYAPKGVGALYAKNGTTIEPLIHGAGQESGRRAGTENIILDVALGKACEIAQAFIRPEAVSRMSSLREYFYDSLKSRFKGMLHLNGHAAKRLPNTLNVSFRGFVGSDLLKRMPEVAASTGSACHEGKNIVSPVLNAMGVEEDISLGAIRFSLGRHTTTQEIDTCVELLTSIIHNSK